NLLLGDNVEWKQALDVLKLLDEWQDFTVSHMTVLYANGPIASLAASYVLAMRQGPAPEVVVMRNSIASFRELLDHEELPNWAIPFDALTSLDLMQPFTSSATNDIHSWILDPLDSTHAKTAVPPKVKVTTMENFVSSDW